MDLILPGSCEWSGAEASLNLDHPMAKGARLAAVAAPGGGFIDLVRGVASVPTNGSLSTIFGVNTGPVVTASNGVWNSIANAYNDGSPSAVTLACVIHVPALLGNGVIANPFITFGNWNGNFGVGLQIAGTTTANNWGVYSNGTTQNFNTGEWNMVAGHSYFFVVSWGAGKLHAGMRDLTTGYTFSNVATTALVTTSQNSIAYGIGIGTAGGLNRSAGGNVAAVAYSVGSFLNRQQIQDWLEAPFDYWYDPSAEAVLFSGLATLSGSVPGNMHGIEEGSIATQSGLHLIQQGIAA